MSTPRTDAFIDKPASDIFAHACQLERELQRLSELLPEIAEYLDDCSDVHDGSDGTPQPNRAMVLRHELEQFLSSPTGDVEHSG